MPRRPDFYDKLKTIGISRKNVSLLYTFTKKLDTSSHPYQNEYSAFMQITDAAYMAKLYIDEPLPKKSVEYLVRVLSQNTSPYMSKLYEIIDTPMFTPMLDYKYAMNEWSYRCNTLLTSYQNILSDLNGTNRQNAEDARERITADINNRYGRVTRRRSNSSVSDRTLSYSRSPSERSLGYETDEFDEFESDGFNGSIGGGRKAIGRRQSTRRRNVLSKKKASTRRRNIGWFTKRKN
jgi:hypothetical protein